MKKKSPFLALLIFSFGLLGGIYAQDAQQTALPVMLISPLDGNKSLIRGWQPAMGQGISEMLVESLEGSNNKFQVLEPTDATDSQKSETPDSNSAKSGQANSAHPKKSGAGTADSESSDASDSDNSTKNESDSSADSDFTFCGDVMEFAIQTNSTKIGDFLS